MNRKEKIIEYMKSEEYLPLKKEELISVLDVPKSDVGEFEHILDELIMEGKVLPVRKSRFKAAEENVITGKLRCSHNGYFGFVETQGFEGDIYISGDKLADAIDGDFVAVIPENKKNSDNLREGYIIRVLKRANKKLTGVITRANKKQFFIKPDNRAIFVQITAPASDIAKKGDRVLLEIKEYSKSGDLLCEIIHNIGKADDFKSCVEALLCRHEIKSCFDEETLEEAKKAPQEIDDISDRRDLRDELIFTIDGSDARDFDDAVSLDRLDNGNFKLGVHIADVTHYVKADTALDNEAFKRGTSIYLADRVIPMFPFELSNGICSLLPDKDRLTLSLYMEIDKEGNILSHELFKGVIRSKARLTYDLAAELLEGEDEELKKQYKKILPTLKRMKRLAGYLNKKRVKRGSINFDFPEAKITVDKKGYPEKIEKEKRTEAHKIIEEFMIAANETVAEYAFWSEIPFIFRVHETPDKEKIESFAKFIFNFGITIKGRIDKEDGIHPKALQAVLKKAEGTPEEGMISRYMLRSLMKAEYKPQNTGHFGLASEYYCHFTSPIRRYPDLLVHRILKKFLNGDDLSEYIKRVEAAARHSSEAEKNAEMTERDIDDIMKAQFMSKFLGESFKGKVSGVTKFGLFIELENTVEGLLRIENIHDDFYVYDEDKRLIIGRKKKKTYKIGDNFSVMVARCDIVSGSIDFLPANATLKNINSFYSDMRKKEDNRQDWRRYGRSQIPSGKKEKKWKNLK